MVKRVSALDTGAAGRFENRSIRTVRKARVRRGVGTRDAKERVWIAERSGGYGGKFRARPQKRDALDPGGHGGLYGLHGSLGGDVL